MANFVLRNNLYLMAALGVAVASYVALNWSSMPVLQAWASRADGEIARQATFGKAIFAGWAKIQRKGVGKDLRSWGASPQIVSHCKNTEKTIFYG